MDNILILILFLWIVADTLDVYFLRREVKELNKRVDEISKLLQKA